MSHEKGHLPLFKSPLVTGHDPEYKGHSTPMSEENDMKQMPSRLAETDDQALHDNPQFHRHAEATNAELFYDLFFVANLTVFTAVHEVNDSSTLKQYIGFFCILWFTWYQVGLYDVRFSTDSVFERITKALQFLVMIGFAIVGPKFKVGKKATDYDEGPDTGYFKALTLVIMVSRLVLVCQYLQSMWFTRHYKKTRLPMALITGTYFVAAIIYMGLYWSFHTSSIAKDNSYIAWYVVAILETVVAICVSSVWRNISFKGTHLVQRMSLLTLIILGEGVMGLSKTCQKIVKSEKELDFSASTIGNIICAVLILYFIYMVYFDWMQEEHFGTIRQQMWSFLHFPLHLALVLAVEGISQCISWRAAVVRSNKLLNQFTEWQTDLGNNSTTWDDVATAINAEASDLIYASLSSANGFTEIGEGLSDLDGSTNATAILRDPNADSDTTGNAFVYLLGTLYKTIFTLAGFIPPEDKAAEDKQFETIDFTTEQSFDSVLDVTDKQAGVFTLTFGYFFVSIGLVVIICCIIAGLSKREKNKVHWARLTASGIIGAGLCLLSTMVVGKNQTVLSAFAFSPWVLPTVTICLFLVVILNSVKPAIPDFSSLSRIASRRSTH